MKLSILALAFTFLLLAACVKPPATPSPVPQRSTPETLKFQATLPPADPEARSAGSIPRLSPTSGMFATPVPTPTVGATSTPMPTTLISPIPTATPVKDPPSPTAAPDMGPTPAHPAPVVFPTPSPTPPVRQAQPPVEYPTPGNTPEPAPGQQQPRFRSWLPPADCSGENAKFSVSPVDPDNLW